MITYDNYYKITEQSDKEKYDVIVESVFDPMVESIVGDNGADIKTADLSKYADDFLKEIGLDENTDGFSS